MNDYITISGGGGTSVVYYSTELTNIATNKSNTSKTMKETKQTQFNIKYLETTKVEHEYDVLAESLEDAKKKIADGKFNPKRKTLEYTVEEVK